MDSNFLFFVKKNNNCMDFYKNRIYVYMCMDFYKNRMCMDFYKNRMYMVFGQNNNSCFGPTFNLILP